MIERNPGYLDFQFAKRMTGSVFEGTKTGKPRKKCAQAFYVKTQPTKIWVEVSAA